MKKILLIFMLVWTAIFSVPLLAQDVSHTAYRVLGTSSDPTGNACVFSNSANPVLMYNGNLYSCGVGNTYTEISGSGGLGTVTSVGLVGTANQLTVTGASPITTSGSWTISIPNLFTLPGLMNVHASTAGGSGLNLGATGAAPTSPNEADVWWKHSTLQFQWFDGTNTNTATSIQAAPTSGHCAQFSGTAGILADAGAACGTTSGTVTSVGLAGTANQIMVTGSTPITSSGSWTLSLPAAIALGTDNSTAGTVQLANGSAAFHTILGSSAGANTSINFGTMTDGKSCTFASSGSVLACNTTAGTGTVTASGSPAADDFVYWTTSTNITKVTAPTTNGVYWGIYNVTGSAAVPPTLPASSALPAGLVLGTVDTGTPNITFGTNSITASKPFTVGGSVGLLTMTEGTCSGAAASSDVLCADATLHAFKSSFNNGSFVAIPQLAGDLGGTAASPQVTNGSNITNASIPNSGLAHAATTPNGQTCTLGSTCNVNVGATAHSVAINQGNGSAITGVGAGTTGQVLRATTTADPSYIDFPTTLYIPSGDCNNVTGGAGWSIGSGGTVGCRGGTNNLGGFITITDTSSTFAQFTVMLPEDWDTGTNPYIRVFFSSASDTTNGHTVIPQIKVSCPTAANGTVSDDATFSAAQSLSTTTFGGSAVANGFYNSSNVQIGSTQMTGCIAGGMMIVQVGRATDTATGNINFYGASLTIPRLIVVQAN